MSGPLLRHLYRFCRYEVFISYGPDMGGANDWLGMYLTRRGADRAFNQAVGDPKQERPQQVILLGLPREPYIEKPILDVRTLP